jgi:hypothetical protein
MNNKVVIPLLCLLVLVFGVGLTPRALAQQSATKAAEPIGEEEVKDSVKKRLEGSLNEKLEKVKGVLQEPGKLYGYFGQVGAVQADQFTVKRNDQERTVLINSKTELLFTPATGSRETIKAEEITKDWYVLAMGETDNSGQLVAQRVAFYETSPLPAQTRKVVFGKVTEIEAKKLILKNHDERTLTITNDTQLTISGVVKPDIADVTVDDKAVAIFEEDTKELTLKALFVWPGTANPEAADNQVNAKESTASAEPSPKAGE